MLKSNSKKARENTRQYIKAAAMEAARERCEWGGRAFGGSFEEIAREIREAFRGEYAHEIRRIGERRAFEEWGRGLAFGGLFDFLLCAACADIAEILEENDIERALYMRRKDAEETAAEWLFKMIYREIFEA